MIPINLVCNTSFPNGDRKEYRREFPTVPPVGACIFFIDPEINSEVYLQVASICMTPAEYGIAFTNVYCNELTEAQYINILYGPLHERVI